MNFSPNQSPHGGRFIIALGLADDTVHISAHPFEAISNPEWQDLALFIDLWGP